MRDEAVGVVVLGKSDAELRRMPPGNIRCLPETLELVCAILADHSIVASRSSQILYFVFVFALVKQITTQGRVQTHP